MNNLTLIVICDVEETSRGKRKREEAGEGLPGAGVWAQTQLKWSADPPSSPGESVTSKENKRANV